MKNLLKLEHIFILAFSIYLFSLTGAAWWIFLVFFLAPDVSMLGYLSNPKVGAYVYNLFHHYATAIMVYLIGCYIGIHALEIAGTILLGHVAFDRILGYGLKYTDSFQHTHLGYIGKKIATRIELLLIFFLVLITF